VSELPASSDQRRPSELAFLREDLARYRQGGRLKWYEPSLWSVCEYRFRRWGDSFRWRLVRRFFWVVTSVSYTILRLVTGIDLPRRARIGPGLRIWHFGGIFVHFASVIGRNCTIRHQVTIGSRREEFDVPLLGDDVDIGAGAKVLGKIRIGNRVTIGANAVVLDDVPDDYLAVGVPARIRPKSKSVSGDAGPDH
jgi:serine O-acetyltransferase